MTAQDAAPNVFHTEFIGHEEIAEGTMAFHFKRPRDYQFIAGQCADVTLLNPPETDSEGNIRTFSITSAPFENQLSFATRMRDTAFKRSIRKMPPGTVIQLGPAGGSFILHKNSKKPAVFLAGGIGITPFRSIVRQATQDQLPHKLYLFYSNHRPEDTPFLQELQDMQKSNSNFHLIATMTGMTRSKQKWDGETGVINKEMIARHVTELQGPIYSIAGPPAMVSAMRQMLIVSGMDEDDIRTEEFGGY